MMPAGRCQAGRPLCVMHPRLPRSPAAAPSRGSAAAPSTHHDRLRLRANHERIAILLEAAAGRNQASDDHVFLQAQEACLPCPLIAASVNTRVVSWNEAAEIKLSVVNAAFVIPRRTGFPSAGLPSFFKTRSFSSSNTKLAHLTARQEFRVARIFDPHFPQHLTNDDLNVLVVDRSPLQPIHILHFVHQILLQFVRARARRECRADWRTHPSAVLPPAPNRPHAH